MTCVEQLSELGFSLLSYFNNPCGMTPSQARNLFCIPLVAPPSQGYALTQGPINDGTLVRVAVIPALEHWSVLTNGFTGVGLTCQKTPG